MEVDVEEARRFFSVLEKSLTGYGFAFVVPTNLLEVHSLVFEPGVSEVGHRIVQNDFELKSGYVSHVISKK